MEPELFLEVREVLTLDQLGEFVAKHHTRDLFRLETLPFYNAASDDDDFLRYLRGEPAPTAEAKQPWLDRIRTDVAAGRAWRRIHAVTHPLLDYVRYECEWGYVPNTAAGEQVRIAELTPALAQVGDFLLRKIRDDAGMTSGTEAGRRAGFSQAKVSRMARGTRSGSQRRSGSGGRPLG